MKQIILGLVVVLASCSTPNPGATCSDGTCKDPAFPYCDSSGAVSGDPGACIAVSCTPGEIKACEQDQALTCNVAGNGYELVSCQLGCSESPTPHCKYLQPRYLPTACDSVATSGDLTVSSTGNIDPNLDQTCTGGVSPQTGAPEVCVIHQKTITVPDGITLGVLGKSDKTGRVVAFVADNDLTVDGTLDLSGHSSVNGPGGGTFVSGTVSGNVSNGDDGGGGGAGGATAGGAGGSSNSSGTGMDGAGQPGGAATANPALLAAFIGGGASAYIGDPTILVGGGGGAAMLISCHGAVRISGNVNAGGGGGRGGPDQIIPFPGEGGGAGGNVSIEGVDVELTGGLFANGGGGGAGDYFGATANGQDGTMSDSQAASGGSASGAGSGGAGGIGAHLPGFGLHPAQANGSAGGGGGSVGYLQVYAPAGTTPNINPAHVSPALQATGVALTK